MRNVLLIVFGGFTFIGSNFVWDHFRYTNVALAGDGQVTREKLAEQRSKLRFLAANPGGRNKQMFYEDGQPLEFYRIKNVFIEGSRKSGFVGFFQIVRQDGRKPLFAVFYNESGEIDKNSIRGAAPLESGDCMPFTVFRLGVIGLTYSPIQGVDELQIKGKLLNQVSALLKEKSLQTYREKIDTPLFGALELPPNAGVQGNYVRITGLLSLFEHEIFDLLASELALVSGATSKAQVGVEEIVKYNRSGILEDRSKCERL